MFLTYFVAVISKSMPCADITVLCKKEKKEKIFKTTVLPLQLVH